MSTAAEWHDWTWQIADQVVIKIPYTTSILRLSDFEIRINGIFCTRRYGDTMQNSKMIIQAFQVSDFVFLL